MTNPRELAEYFSFTEDEVRELRKAYNMSFEEARAQCDGYKLVTQHANGQTVYSMTGGSDVGDG